MNIFLFPLNLLWLSIKITIVNGQMDYAVDLFCYILGEAAGNEVFCLIGKSPSSQVWSPRHGHFAKGDIMVLVCYVIS